MVKSQPPVMGYAVREVEWLMATYHMTLDHAVWHHPRVATLVLMPAFAERQGHTGLTSYANRASLEARAQVDAVLQDQFEIVDIPWRETGWQIGEPPDFLKYQSR